MNKKAGRLPEGVPQNCQKRLKTAEKKVFRPAFWCAQLVKIHNNYFCKDLTTSSFKIKGKLRAPTKGVEIS